MINKKIFLLLGLATLLLTASCGDDDTTTIYGNWTKTYDAPSPGRAYSLSFLIEEDNGDETFYLGLGYNGDKDPGEQYLGDFLLYDGATSWIPVDSFPGKLRKGACGFAIAGKGYLFGGMNDESSSKIYYKELWEFNPKATKGTQWTLLNDSFPGSERTEATTFVLNDIAYIVGGKTKSGDISKNCYKFDPTLHTFTKINDIGYSRASAFSFVIDGKAYVGGGYTNNGLVQEFEFFDPETEKWNEDKEGNRLLLRNLYLKKSETDDISHYDNVLDIQRYATSTFVLDGKGYIAGGSTGASILGDCWEYDPATDLWTQKNSFEYGMNFRSDAASFVLKGVPYILTGYSGNYLSDMWSLDPISEAD